MIYKGNKELIVVSCVVVAVVAVVGDVGVVIVVVVVVTTSLISLCLISMRTQPMLSLTLSSPPLAAP